MRYLIRSLSLCVPCFLTGCDQNTTRDYTPIETNRPSQPGDFNFGGMRVQPDGTITHLRDDETGEWLPLTPEESALLSKEYRALVDKVGRPEGYNR